METNPKAIGQLVRQARMARGLSEEDLAGKAGTSQSTITRIEHGQFKRLPSHLPQIALVLDLEFPGLQLQRTSPAAAGDEAPSPPITAQGAPDFPVHSSAEGGPGQLIISSDAIEYLPRPHVLQGVRKAYGILIAGESMIPAFRPGDVAWVNPLLPPIRDAEMIFYAGLGTGEERATIKTLMSMSEDKWRVRQYNPRRDFSLARSEWKIAQRVVGKFNRR